MHRLSKAILIILIGLIVLAVAAVIGVNLYIQSPGTQAQIQTELSKAAGLPLQITSTTVTPWGGLHMSGISVPADGGTQIDAKSFDADCRVLMLLHGQLAIDKMTVDSPRFVWVQNADGNWTLPTLPDTHAKKDSAAKNREPKEKSPAVSIQTLEVVNGSFELIGAEKKRLLVVNDIHITASLPLLGEALGSLAATRLAWQDAINFSKVRCTLHYKDGKLAISDLTSAVSGGTAEGIATVQIEGKENPFQSTLKFNHIDLAKLTAEANAQLGQSSGLLNADVNLHGDTQKLEAMEGNGRLTLSDAQFGQLQALQAVSQIFQIVGAILQIPDLADLRFKNVESDFRIINQHAYIDRLLLDASDLQFTSKGNFRFDGRLSFDAKLALSERVWSALPSSIAASLAPPDENKRRAIDFTISGHADKPKTDLLEKIQFDDVLTTIFGGGKKKKDKDKDKKKDSAAPAETAPSNPPATPISAVSPPPQPPPEPTAPAPATPSPAPPQ